MFIISSFSVIAKIEENSMIIDGYFDFRLNRNFYEVKDKMNPRNFECIENLIFIVYFS